MTEPSELRARILEAARREPSPTRSQATTRIALIIAVALVVDVALFFLFGGAHRGERPLPFLVGTLAGSLAVALAAAWGAFARGRSMLGRSPRWLVAIAIGTPILLMAWMRVWNALYPDTTLALSGRIGVRCFAFSLALGVWPLALLLRSCRERNPVAPGVAGAARGVAVGALAWVMVTLWCPLANTPHVAVGHLLPLFILSILGGWLGQRLTAVAGDLRGT